MVDGGAARLALLVVIARIVVLAVGLMSSGPRQLGNDERPAGLWGRWAAWDGVSYVQVAEKGYPLDQTSPDLRFIAYFPLYPVAGRLLSQATGWPAELSLLLICNGCAIIGFGFFYSWVRNLVDQPTAIVSVLLLASSASAVFFSAVLTEGLFFMLVAITLWLMQKRRLWWAAAVCGIATLCRPTGVALAATLVLYALFEARQSPVALRIGRAALIGMLAAAGALAYEGFLLHRYHDPAIYSRAQMTWQKEDDTRHAKERDLGYTPRSSLRFALQRAMTPPAWNRAIALAMVMITLIGLMKSGPVPRVLFVLPLLIFLMTALPNHGLRISSVVRYESAGLPVFVLFAWWLARVRAQGAVVAFLIAQGALQLYYAHLFCNYLWVG